MQRLSGRVRVGLGLMVAMIIVVLTAVPTIFATSRPQIRVKGQLVGSELREPIVAARVLVIPDRAWATDEVRREWTDGNWSLFEDMYQPASYRVDVRPTERSTTGDDGVFDVLVVRGWCKRRPLISLFSKGPPPRWRMGALRIEIEGRAPVVLDAPHGTWTEHPDDDELWATYDLGVIEIPGDE